MYILMFGGLRVEIPTNVATQKVSALEMLENPERQCKEDFLLYKYLKTLCCNISYFSGHFLFGWKDN